MAEKNNMTCAICGNKYTSCIVCDNVKTYKPWRTITDTIGCYKIYMAIHDYNNGSISKIKAKELLEQCAMPDTFQPHIKKEIDKLMIVPKKSVRKVINTEETKEKKDNE